MKRFPSIDIFRGVVMFFLIAETTGIYSLAVLPALKGTVIGAIGLQFQHHPRRGLRLWDLGQPLFMFISGAAMYLSYTKRWQSGVAWKDTLIQALRRSLILFILGWTIYLIVPVEGNPRGAFLHDILPQLALGSLLAFLTLRLSIKTQIWISFGLLAITELSYRLWGMVNPEFDAKRPILAPS